MALAQRARRPPGGRSLGRPAAHGWLPGVFLPAAGVTAGYISKR